MPPCELTLPVEENAVVAMLRFLLKVVPWASQHSSFSGLQHGFDSKTKKNLQIIMKIDTYVVIKSPHWDNACPLIWQREISMITRPS